MKEDVSVLTTMLHSAWQKHVELERRIVSLEESVRIWQKVAETVAWTLGVESGYEDPELWRRDLQRVHDEVVRGEWDQ